MSAWTADQVRTLRDAYGSRSDTWLVENLRHTIEEINDKAAELTLAKNKGSSLHKGTRKMPRWTDEEKAELRRLHPLTRNLEIARALGKSEKSVASMAHKLGLRKDRARLVAMGGENVSLRRDRLDSPGADCSPEGNPEQEPAP